VKADLERGGNNLTGMVKAEGRDLCIVGRTGVWDGPTAAKCVQQ